MYDNDPEIDDSITSIPRKEDLCVSRTLGATLYANNCYTAQLCQSRKSKRIIKLSRVNGITDKDKFIHYLGNCSNRMRNTWCNSTAIRFGRRIGEALGDDLPAFAPHLLINGGLMSIHRWLLDNCSISTFSFMLADTHTTFFLTSKQDRLIDTEINETCNDLRVMEISVKWIVRHTLLVAKNSHHTLPWWRSIWCCLWGMYRKLL